MKALPIPHDNGDRVFGGKGPGDEDTSRRARGTEHQELHSDRPAQAIGERFYEVRETVGKNQTHQAARILAVGSPDGRDERMEPTGRFELPASRLRSGCSTTELRRPGP